MAVQQSYFRSRWGGTEWRRAGHEEAILAEKMGQCLPIMSQQLGPKTRHPSTRPRHDLNEKKIPFRQYLMTNNIHQISNHLIISFGEYDT